jgi:O-antigen/teichoic acid export membrane protein
LEGGKTGHHDIIMTNLIYHRIWRGTQVVFLGKVFSVLGALLLSGVLARMLPSGDMGVFFLTSSLVGIMAIVCQLGLNQSVVRNIAQAIARDRYDIAQSVAYKSLLFGGVTALVCALILGSGGLNIVWGMLLGESSHAPLSLLVFAWIGLTSIQSLLGEIFRGLHAIGRATLYGAQSGTSGTLSLALGLLMLLILMAMGRTLTLNLALATLVLGQLACVCAAVLALTRHFHSLPYVKRSANRLDLSLTIPTSLMLTGILIFVVGQIDLWVLGFLRSEEEVAIYGAASTVVKYVSSVNLLLSAVIPPTVAELYAKERRQELENMLRATALISTLFALGMALLLWIFGGQILSLIFGIPYAVAAPVLAILALGHIVNAYTGNCGVLLIMAGRDRVVLNVTLIFGLVTTALAFVLIKYYGLIGVAFASAFGLAGMNVSMWLSARHYLGIWTHAKFKRTDLKLWLGRAVSNNAE